jgi:hypothetical protein
VQVIALVRQYKRQDRTIIGAFADWTGQQIRERAPDIPRIFSAKETLLIYLKYFLGLLPFFALHADYFEVPLFSSIANDRLMENMTHKSESPSSCGQKCKNFFTRILLSILVRLFAFISCQDADEFDLLYSFAGLCDLSSLAVLAFAAARCARYFLGSQ